MRFLIRHRTHFTYDQPAFDSHNEVRLKPRESLRQRTLGFRLEVIPRAAVLEYTDTFGNLVHNLSVAEPHRELVVVSDALVQRMPPRPLVHIDDSVEQFLAGGSLRAQEQYDFLHQSPCIPFSEPLKKLFWTIKPHMNEPVAQYTGRLVAWVRDRFAYEPGVTQVDSDLNHLLSVGAGACQDFAHLAIGVLRLAGVPARYVSGYLVPKAESDRAQPVGHLASHAWLEALLPQAGWTGFDPTHGSPATDHYVQLAIGRDRADVPPLRGVYRSAGQRQTMQVSLDIHGLLVLPGRLRQGDCGDGAA
jgi:transglutaminase-like putative cysteine protease